MNRFFIYKEYGAKYEMMIKDVASAHRTMPEWETYQKGLEILASTLGSVKSSDDKTKKSLTIGDLLVKVCAMTPNPWYTRRSLYAANPKDLQVPSVVCRTAEIHPGRGLPQLAYGGRWRFDAAPRGDS